MSKRRIELPSLAAHEPQSCMYTIPSPRHLYWFCIEDYYSLTDTVLIYVMIVAAVSSLFYTKPLMKILSNFDTKLYDTLKEQYLKQYGSDNVMIVRRASIFFWLYIMFPLMVMLCVLAFMAWLSFGVTIRDPTLENILHIGSLVSSLVILVVRWSRILLRYFDYTMDFCIITPKELVSYNQAWLFNRHTEIIDTEKIKTINKIPQWFFGSIFNFANIVFLSEWDKDIGDIALSFVEDPEETYKQVRRIIEPHLNQQAGEQIFVKKEQI